MNEVLTWLKARVAEIEGVVAPEWAAHRASVRQRAEAELAYRKALEESQDACKHRRTIPPFLLTIQVKQELAALAKKEPTLFNPTCQEMGEEQLREFLPKDDSAIQVVHQFDREVYGICALCRKRIRPTHWEVDVNGRHILVPEDKDYHFVREMDEML